ncbi:MAG: RICIN domain-containing protein [Lachnospiraceae bacterium]|nr:RICIN domain-containing protein [Lachnospiraceae bacterium]
MSRLIVGILIAAMSITSAPISVYAKKSADVESVAEETPSDTETKMPKETAGEERFGETKTDTQEIGEEKSADESVTDIVEPESSTDKILDSKEEPATETLEQDETQTDVEETLEYDETRTDTEEALDEDEELAANGFVPRTTDPGNNAYYTNGNPYVGPCNCTYYAWGRAHELLGYKPPFFGITGQNAKSWWDQPGGFEKGSTPRLGAIMCWGASSDNAYGHVAVVEAIGNGTISFSEASYDPSYAFVYKENISTSTLSNIYRGTFQGYIYLPGIPSGHNPIGTLDSVIGGAGSITVRGWALDQDAPNQPLAIDVYIGGPAGSGVPYHRITADKLRTDVGNAYPGTGNYHGFLETIATEKTGVQDVYVYALNVGDGNDNPQIGKGTVTISDRVKGAYMNTGYSRVISDGYYHISSSFGDQWWLTIRESSMANGGNVEVDDYSGKVFECDEQLFYFEFIDDGDGRGFYKITNKLSGKCLDVERASEYMRDENGNPTNVQQWEDNGSSAQRWAIREVDGGEKGVLYTFKARNSGFCLDLFGGEDSLNNGIKNISMYEDNGTPAQQWRLIPYTSSIVVEKLTLNKTTLTLQVGETATLTAAISPDNATNKTLTWQSSNISVADIDNSGTVIAKSEGTAVITVTSANGKTASCEVTVINNDPYGDILKEDIPEDGKIPEGLWLAGIANGYSYTGKAIKPEVRVYDHKTLLKEKKDYTLSYKNNTNAGNADSLKPPTITVTGKGNYKGKETQSFTISPKSLEDEDITADNIVLKENGKVQKPVPTITWNNKKLAKKKDYTISYLNEAADGAYMKTGTYSIRVKGAGNYTGERTITLTITQDAVKPLKKISISKVNTELQFNKIASYTGNAVKPDRYTLTFTTKDASGNNNTVTLKEGSDYKVSYQNNVKAGKASILFQGINNYSGTLRKTYNIAPYDIETDTDKKIEITLSDAYAYTKGGCKPKPIVMFGKTALTEGIDYTLSYQNNTNLSDDSNTEKIPTVIIKGKGNFKGTCKETFAIRPKDIGTLTLTAADKTWQNKSNLYKTKIVIKDEDQKALGSGKDYSNTILYEYDSAVTLADGTTRNAGETVSPQDIIPAGTTIRVTVKADGKNYTGTLTGTYRIVKADIGKASVKIPPQIYTGKPIEPDKSQITVKLKGQTLAEEDYDISCSNNINKGTATMIIKGKNDCGGTKTVKFKIKEKGFLWWWR